MQQKADLQSVEPLRKILKQFNRNNQCVYPGCRERPINSHIIAESVLKLLATQGEVLTWERSEDDIIVNTIRGHKWDYVHKQPKRVSIKAGVTYPVFCREHDNNIFEALEKPGFSYEPQKVALLAYRALCYKTWNPNLEKKLELFLSNKGEETAQQWSRLLSLKTLVEARQKFHDMLETRDYRQMRWIKRICPIDPCLACTGVVIPYAGHEDAMNIASGNTITAPEDVITFTFFPEKRLNASTCIITWFRDNKRGENFKEFFNSNSVSEADIRSNIITSALRMSLVYASQTWWDTLTPE